MTSEMKEKILQAMKAKNISYDFIAAQAGVSLFTIYSYFSGRHLSMRIYAFLDVLDAVGLELSINGTPVKSHQDLVEIAKSKPLPKEIRTRSSGYRFIRGENVNTDTVYKVLLAQGLEPRII